MHLHFIKSDISLGLSSGRLSVKNLKDGSLENDFPFADVEGISIFGNPHLSTVLLRGCMQNGIPILFYSSDGHYFGRLLSTAKVDPFRQKAQLYASDNPDFRLILSKKIISAKINNSLAFLKSRPNIYPFADEELRGMYHSLEYIHEASTISEVMGFEGRAAKVYFACLPKLLENEFCNFKGRSARPPKDPFNSMLSYSYSLLYRNIIGALEGAGLNPYFAFLHDMKHGHAALASDLIEEWRAVLVDRVVLDFANDEDLGSEDFHENSKGSVFMDRKIMKRLTTCLGDAMVRKCEYFSNEGDRKHYGFQVALQMKINNLIKAIEKNDPSLYIPFIWNKD